MIFNDSSPVLTPEAPSQRDETCKSRPQDNSPSAHYNISPSAHADAGPPPGHGIISPRVHDTSSSIARRDVSRVPKAVSPSVHDTNSGRPCGDSPSDPDASSRIVSAEPSQPFAIEIFCGSAGLSAAIIKAGVSCIPIDYGLNRFTPKATPRDLDLTTFSGQRELWRLMSSPALCFVHMSPPCGTASRAREKPLPKHARDKGWPQPQPLRSEEFPMGLPNLAETLPRQVSRVAKANKLFLLCAEICQCLTRRGVPWTLENPRNSLFWWIPEVESILQLRDVGDVFFQHCMHGSERDKWTRLRCYPTHQYVSLALTCDKSHPHKPWGAYGPGQFATADEAEFPGLLCERIARIVLRLTSQNFQNFLHVAPQMVSLPDHDLRTTTSSSTTVSVSDVRTCPGAPRAPQAQRIAAGIQPRGNMHNIMPEYRTVVRLAVPENERTGAEALVGKCPSMWLGTKLPSGSRVLSVVESGVPGDRGAFLEVGVPYSASEFTQLSLKLEHPFAALAVDDDVLRSIFSTLTSPASSTRTRRDQALAHWTRRAEALQAQEAQLRASAHRDVRPAIESKRLMLFCEMLRAVNFPDPEKRVHAMASGFPLAGNIDRTGLFPELARPASSCLPDLWRDARESQRLVLATLGPTSCAELDDAVTVATREEVEAGWLRGPFTSQELAQRHGLWVPARRFGIKQGPKVRVIDDYSEMGQNGCVGSSEKVDVGGVDVVAGLVRGVLGAVDPNSRRVRVELSDGSVLDGRLHPEWSTSAASTLVGKLWDLKSAYRQLARAPAHASIAIVATWNSQLKRTELYEQLVLPFGSTASVYGFNYVARALQLLLVREFGIICTHYFDDFPCLELHCLADHTQATVDEFFKLLGWTTKAQRPFAPVFDVLGVVCDLTDASSGRCRFLNKPERIAEIASTVDHVVEKGYITRGEARSLRGRIVFARAQVFGKCGAVALRALSDIAESTKGSPALGPNAEAALSWLVRMLRSSRPREVRVRAEPPVFLFVDAACEDRDGPGLPRVTVGGVLFDAARPDLGPCYFGTEVGAEVVSQWVSHDKRQVIAQAELLPVWLAKLMWPEKFANRFNVTFIDNESARHGLIRGYSPVLESAQLINESWLSDASLGATNWFARVPTASNIADKPSRLDFKEVSSLPGSTFYEVSLPKSFGGGNVWKALAARLARCM
jgi:hypothetical protein